MGWDSSDTEGQLREALQAAKQKLVEQDELLSQLTSHPLPYAVVVKVGAAKAGLTGPEAFKIGSRVRIRRDSEFAYQNKSVGIIKGTAANYGWVTVKFESGSANDYRIGLADVDNGLCDLELVDSGGNVEIAVISYEGKHFEVLLPEDKKVGPGDSVKISPKTLQIIDVVEPNLSGEIVVVRKVVDTQRSEIDQQGSVRVVFNGRFTKLEDGDRVILDPTASVVVGNLGKEDVRFGLKNETNVSWKDIGGLEDAKKQMIEAVEFPYRYPEVYRFYQKKPIKGILLYGPPGCGKTMLGKATATALARIHNRNSIATGFIYVKGPEILDRYIGTSEATIRSIFQSARQHKAKHGYPAVIFIDEADSILNKRGSGISSDIERTIVPMFLAEMDGLEDSAALVILATNRADILDPAIVRDGRIDRKVGVCRPNKSDAVNIFTIYLSKVPTYRDYTARELSKIGSEELFSEGRVLYEIELSSGGKTKLTLGQICNGGMIAGIVDQATSIAMHRDLESGRSSGLIQKDIVEAINRVFTQNLDLDHTDDLADLVHDFRKEVVGVRKLKQSGERV